MYGYRFVFQTMSSKYVGAQIVPIGNHIVWK